MEKIIETSWNELWPIVNVLNEVCHGLRINNLENTIGFKHKTIAALLQKIASYEVEEAKSYFKIEVELNDCEIKIVKKCFIEVLKQIEDWEFSTRIGISTSEIRRIMDRLI